MEGLEKQVEAIMLKRWHIVVGVCSTFGAMIAFGAPIAIFIFQMKVDIALIQQNHEAHMQNAIEKIANLEEEQSEIMMELRTQHDAIIKLIQMHE